MLLQTEQNHAGTVKRKGQEFEARNFGGLCFHIWRRHAAGQWLEIIIAIQRHLNALVTPVIVYEDICFKYVAGSGL